MKSLSFITMMLFSYVSLFGQLRGSGIIVNKQYDFTNFDKLELLDLDGTITVEIGQKWSILVAIDENLLPLLAFDENKSETKLHIFFKDNKNNNKYIENTNINIKITMPEASVIKHNGNSKLFVHDIVGRYLGIENGSNATTTLSGSIDQLDVKNTGNGNLIADQLTTKVADIKCTGNGNVKVNIVDKIKARVSGNGSVFNSGKAIFENSSTIGNGRLIQQ
ncbi:MAG TPA: DUF2807 domain-containing protein [Saprospiraceae bacterium]|nr:DUF2807 domain-containing protein [Saprospiraceae bacterium]